MSWEHFTAAVDRAVELEEDHIFLTGGEPTIHPLFWEMVGHILRLRLEFSLVTNGKVTESALILERLARWGYGYVELSQDRFHEPVDPRTLEAFENDGPYHWDRLMGKGGPFRIYRPGQWNPPYIYHYVSVRDSQKTGLVAAGRGRNIEGADQRKYSCACDSTFIRPDGRVFRCGCEDAPQIGFVTDPVKAWGPLVGCPRRRRALEKSAREYLEKEARKKREEERAKKRRVAEYLRENRLCRKCHKKIFTGRPPLVKRWSACQCNVGLKK
jgi:hypothetical protein